MDSCNCSKWDNWEVDVAVIICNKSIRPGEESQGKQDLFWLKKKKKVHILSRRKEWGSNYFFLVTIQLTILL